MLVVALVVVVTLLSALREIVNLNKKFNQVQQSREFWLKAYTGVKAITDEFFENYEK